MIPKVALHSRGQDLFPEVTDFQACGDGLAKEFVVCFDLFVRGFHKNFSMFVAEAHQGLRPSGYLGDGQTAVIQRFTNIEKDNRVHDVAEYLSAHRIDGPLGQRKQAEVLLAGLDDALDVRAAEVVGEQFRRSEALVGEQHEVSEADRQPVLLTVLHRGVFVGMVQHEVALPLEGVVPVDIHVGIDLLPEQLYLLPLAEVHVAAAHEAVLALVQAGPELVVEILEREALACGHPADEGLLRPVVEGVYHLLGYVPRVKNQGVDGDVKTDGHVVHHGHDGADVQDVAGDDVVPYREPHLLVQHQHEARLNGCGLNPMAAQGVERVIVDVIRQRRGVHVAATAEVRMPLAHLLDECLEERHPRAVAAHHREVSGVAAERCRRDVAQDVRSEGLFHEAVAADAAPVAEDAMQDVAQDPLAVRLFREGSLQDVRHARPCEEAHQEVSVSKHGVDLSLGEDVNITRKAHVIPSDFVEAVGDGIVGYEAPLRGKEDAGLSVWTEPHDLPEALPYNLSGVELPSVLDVPGLLDGGAAADDIAVTVLDQFLNPYECHVVTLDLIVLSSTTNLSIIFDTAKHFYNNLTINQQISRSRPAA